MNAAAGLNLLPAGPLHAAVCATLHATAFSEPWDEASLAVLLSDPGAVALIAVDDAAATPEPLGFIICRQVVDEAEVLTIAVRPSARRRGAGAALLGAAARGLAMQGATRLFLEVAETNTAARGLYASAGFRQVGRRKNYYHMADYGPTDALVLSLEPLAA